MKITVHELILIILILVVIVLGVDHLLLRERFTWQEWRMQATSLLTVHDDQLKKIGEKLNVQRTPVVPEMKEEKREQGIR